MKSQSINLSEFYSLDIELNGRVNQQTGERLFTGILNEKLSLVAKYWLNQLAATVKSEITLLDEQRDELIKKYGEADENGGFIIPQVLTETDESGVEIRKPNPKFLEFTNEFNTLLAQPKEISYTPVKLADLSGVESTNNFSVLFKFIEA
jgi:hypothetical protein